MLGSRNRSRRVVLGRNSWLRAMMTTEYICEKIEVDEDEA